MFPLINSQPGDLIFFHRLTSYQNSSSSNFENAVISSSTLNADIFHVALLVEPNIYTIIHSTPTYGVSEQSLREAIKDTQPDYVELCHINLPAAQKLAAVEWAKQQIGVQYNDIFSPNCLNSKNEKSYYCCQFIDKAYKETNIEKKSIFPPHKLNFKDASGNFIPYWLDYYNEKCPENPELPQGEPGSHPSILRSSTLLEVLGVYWIKSDTSKVCDTSKVE
uniref:Uncharacterized protein n=1 Tax=Acrobeloides nanus TaxID=290746 RepID=A0A914DMY4_9BILA